MLPRVSRLLVLTLGLMMGASSRAEYKLPQTILANGGGAQTGTGYLLQGSIGQTVIGLASGSFKIEEAGFWFSPLLFSSGVEAPSSEATARIWMSAPRPNPFQRVTALSFALPRQCRVTITLFDVSGRAQKVLLDRRCDPGIHWLHIDDRGLNSGVYFCRMAAERFVRTERLVLLH